MSNESTPATGAHPDDDETQALVAGLQARPRQVSAKYFYDERGSKLFDQICELPEYYLTRTEMDIMRRHIDEMAQLIGPDAVLVEYGSGSSTKTRLLLEHLSRPVAYVPVDISREHLSNAAAQLAVDFPDLEILPVCADFTQPLTLPTPHRTPDRNIVFFPGSTIGNFASDDALELLRGMRRIAGDDGGLLIGVDLIKPRQVLESAYNDNAGITAAFNLNLLNHLNRQFDANFDTSAFRHQAVYDEDHQRIEMRLISLKRQTPHINGTTIELNPNEFIVTEHSHKYSPEGFGKLAEQAGFSVKSMWTDDKRLFSVQYLEAG